MEKRGNMKYKILFSIIFLIICLPIFQQFLHFVGERSLQGSVEYKSPPIFSLSGWMSGDYQKKQEDFLTSDFGFHNTLVRVNNQLSYFLFKKPHARGVVLGTNGYLYEQIYIDALNGTDFRGRDTIQITVQKLRSINDTLTKLNKHLVVCLAPGKASFYPEFIPDHLKRKQGETNVGAYRELLSLTPIPVVDFHSYFTNKKGELDYDVYLKNGIHWTTYSAYIASDSLLRFFEVLLKRKLPGIRCKSRSIKMASDSDQDILLGLNLLWEPQREVAEYPYLEVVDTIGREKPSILVIADSYYRTIYNLDIDACFEKSSFWYYNKQVFPESRTKLTYTKDLSVKEEVKKYDIIMLMATDGTIGNLGWGAIDTLYQIYFPKVHKRESDSAL